MKIMTAVQTEKSMPRACIVAGTHSGVGKTTVTLGLLAALRKRGLRVQAFKVGPDFIDPGHHSVITGVPARTLDGWMLPRPYNQQTLWRHMQGQDIGIIEGVMGLFDGHSGKSEAGSTAEMAKWLGVPVLLVVDAAAMARSVAALVYGFRSFDPALRIAGVVFNRIAGPGHLQYLREALESLPPIAVIGGVPHDDTIAIPERHLGLLTAEERRLTPEQINRLAACIEDNLDLCRLLHELPPLSLPQETAETARDAEFRRTGDTVRFGVAKDEAFCFYYPDNLELLERAGAELVFFSPIHDAHLPANIQGLYFGGGYPEVYAPRLSANRSMQYDIRAFIERGGMVYAECGGFMYLTQAIRDLSGTAFPMVGVYPTTVRMQPRLTTLGYAEVTIADPTGLLAGGQVRGHEFHYSALENEDFCGGSIATVYQVRQQGRATPRPEGYLYKRCLASYIHLHFGSNAEFATALVSCARRRPLPD
jgi:cobyrinic acid a,c-diamide synthase